MNHIRLHGALGNINCRWLRPARSSGRIGRPRSDAATRRILHHLTSRGATSGSLCGVESPGFINGLAGIATACFDLHTRTAFHQCW